MTSSVFTSYVFVVKPSLNYWAVRSWTWLRSVCAVLDRSNLFLKAFLSQLHIPPKQMELVKIWAWNSECGNTLLHIVIFVWVSLMIVDIASGNQTSLTGKSPMKMEIWIGESSVNGFWYTWKVSQLSWLISPLSSIIYHINPYYTPMFGNTYHPAEWDPTSGTWHDGLPLPGPLHWKAGDGVLLSARADSKPRRVAGSSFCWHAHTCTRKRAQKWYIYIYIHTVYK